MFSFFRKKTAKNVVTQLPFKTDIHSHILPGIDDGSPDLETSLKLVKGIYDLGIRKTVATPHVISDMYRNTPQTIQAALNILKPAVAAAGMDIEIQAAAEYMMDDYFVKLLRSGEKLLTIKDWMVLTEQSYATPTNNLNEICFELITAGYQPILAHPERYIFYHDDFEQFHKLKDMGFLLQVNMLSITGYYGKPVAKAAKYILEQKLVDFVGTDMHHYRHLGVLSDPQCLELFDKYMGTLQLNNRFDI
jgi:protein-tyrosine phosphatase